ncbi:MAG: carboxypeptidase-like regulatory domain-containing protein [Hyphomicrobiales bacterium]
MRLTLLLTAFLVVLGSVRGQKLLDRSIVADYKGDKLENVLADMSTQAEFDYAFNSSLFNDSLKVNLNSSELTVKEALEELSDQLSISFKIRDNVVLLNPKDHQQSLKINHHISGVVLDQKTRLPIPGVIISDKEMGDLVITDQKGRFHIDFNAESYRFKLAFRKWGFEQKIRSINLHEDQDLTVLLSSRVDFFYKKSVRKIPNGELSSFKTIKLNDNEPEFSRLLLPTKSIDLSQYDELQTKPFQVSFLPWINSNGVESQITKNRFSFNMIAGYSGSLDGVEVGLVTNAERYNVKGLQIAGFSNHVGGNLSGIQIAAFMNTALLKSTGLQIAGGANWSSKGFDGIQLAAALNVSHGAMTGLQISGFSNFSEGGEGLQISSFWNENGIKQSFYGSQISGFGNRVRYDIKGFQVSGGCNISNKISGSQISGFLNISKDIEGVQVSGGVNISKKIKGAQIGILNVADTIRGFQIGIINFAKNLEKGVSVGIISFVRDGYKSLEFNYDILGLYNVSLKTGSSKFYNILTLGYIPNKFNVWTLGYGFGTNHKIYKNFSASVEVIKKVVNYDGNLFKEEDHYFNFNGNLNYRIGKHIEPYIGASISTHIYEDSEKSILDLTNKNAIRLKEPHVKEKNLKTVTWIGYHFGVRYIF